MQRRCGYTGVLVHSKLRYYIQALSRLNFTEFFGRGGLVVSLIPALRCKSFACVDWGTYFDCGFVDSISHLVETLRPSHQVLGRDGGPSRGWSERHLTRESVAEIDHAGSSAACRS